MHGCTERNADMVVSAPNLPEFERILDEFGILVDRLRRIKETSVTISDALIGVQDISKDADCAKPTPNHYFIARCSDLIVDFRDEVDYLEEINTKLLHSVKVE
jgi:hypothetical protein